MKTLKYIVALLIFIIAGLPVAAGPESSDNGEAPAGASLQNGHTVAGVVRDNLGDPLIGVNIMVKGTMTGTVTDTKGFYTIEVPYAEATITVSYIGYTPQEIPVGARTAIDVVLIEDSQSLEEVVVVGYNTQRRETITGAVATITTKELKQSPAANVNNALAGRLPGLMVNQFVGGEFGNDVSQINVRGIATLSSSGSIIIVDGVERDFSYLSPDEIESITILKDASATAQYGIRGADGVIIVTTKRGRSGEKPTVDLRASVGISQNAKNPKYLGSADYATLYNEALINDGYDPNTSSRFFTEETIANFRRAKGDNSDGLGYNYDYYDYAFKPSILQDYSLSVRGGTDRARYFILGGYNYQGSNYKHLKSSDDAKFLRYNFRANVDVDATKRMKISVDIGALITEFSYPGASAANITALANTQPPYLPITLPHNGNATNQEDFENNGGYLLYADADYRYNMLGQLNRTGSSMRQTRTMNGTMRISHELDFVTPGLNVEARFSYDMYNRHVVNNAVATFSTGNLGYPGYSTWNLAGDQSIDVWKNDSAYWIENGVYEPANTLTVDNAAANSVSHSSPQGTARFEARLDYKRSFGYHDLSGMFLWYQQSKRVNNEVPYRYTGLTGRATYAYRNKYLAEFNVGYNGSENFARGNRFGIFPAGSIGWVMSSEDFMSGARWLNHLKIRASFGLVGSDQIGSERFMYLQLYQSSTSYSMIFGTDKNGVSSTWQEGRFANRDLTWEKAEKLNVGIDASFFNQRLTLSVDAFREHRYDIITNLNATDGITRLGFPYIVGNSAPIINSGVVNNHGFELEIGWSGKIGSDARYWIRPNFTYAKNKIKQTNEISYVDGNGVDATWRYATGRSIGQNFCYIFDHFVRDQTEADMLNSMNGGSGYQNFGTLVPGDVVYKDINGDGVINDYDRAAVGYPRLPQIQFGIPFGVSYKNFDVSILLQGSAQTSVLLSGPAVWDFPLYDQSRIGKVKSIHLKRWTPETAATAKYPALHEGIHTNNKNANSSLFLYDASYIRLKNIEIGYTLPQSLTSKAGIQSVRVFVQGLNLVTFDKFGDLDVDPEIRNGDGSWYPVQRVVNFGVNVTF